MRTAYILVLAWTAGTLACTPVQKVGEEEHAKKILELPVLGFDEVARVEGKPLRLSLFQDLRLRAPAASRDQVLWAAIVAAGWTLQKEDGAPSSEDLLSLALYAVGGPWDEKAARAAQTLGVQGTPPEPRAVAQRLQPVFERVRWVKNAPLLERI